MQRQIRIALAVASVLSSVAMTAIAQSITLRPGKYETTVDMDMPGEMKMPSQKQMQCITPDDLKDFSKAVSDPEFARTCKVSDYKIVGNKLTFTSECKDGEVRARGTMEFTFAAESYSGVMTTKDNKGRVMTIKTSGKRIGDCVK
jgi:hypothetical protein